MCICPFLCFSTALHTHGSRSFPCPQHMTHRVRPIHCYCHLLPSDISAQSENKDNADSKKGGQTARVCLCVSLHPQLCLHCYLNRFPGAKKPFTLLTAESSGLHSDITAYLLWWWGACPPQSGKCTL